MAFRSPSIAHCAIFASLLSGHSLIASDLVLSQPIRDSSWQILVGTSAAAANTAVAQNDAGPDLVNLETAPVPEGTAAPSTTVTETGPAPGRETESFIPMAGEALKIDGTAVSGAPPVMSYTEAYNSIPFSRSEYEANPGYRHEAAMELMFRQLRPTTVVKQYTPRAFRYPDFYQYPYARYPYTQIGVRNSWNAYGIPYPRYAR
jgi:hypothetical protein